MRLLFIALIIVSSNLFAYKKIDGLCLGLIETSKINKKIFKDLQRLHIDKLRIGTFWENIEKSPHNYNWERLDKIYKLSKEYNIDLVFVIGYNPRWMTKGKPYQKDLPNNMIAYQRFLQELVNRYKDVKYYEIWNEQNDSAYWKSGENAYIEFLKLSYNTIKSSNKNSIVFNGGIANLDLDYIEKLLDNNSNYTDIINVHFYYHWGIPNYKKIKFINDIIKLAKKYKKKVWITETGIPSGGYSLKHAQKKGYYSYEQAREIVKLLLLIKSIDKHDDIESIFIYNYKDNRYDSKLDSDNFGLLTYNFHYKPSYYALKYFNQLILHIKSINIEKLSFSNSYIRCELNQMDEILYIDFTSLSELYGILQKFKGNKLYYDIEGVPIKWINMKKYNNVFVRIQK